MMKQQAGAGSVFSFEGVPSAGQMIPLGFQHVVAAVVGMLVGKKPPMEAYDRYFSDHVRAKTIEIAHKIRKDVV